VRPIGSFHLALAGFSSISFDQVQEAFPSKKGSELRELLAVLRHLGILNCANPEYPLENRYYRIPILFREKEPLPPGEPIAINEAPA
jgi:hypothetical protein